METEDKVQYTLIRKSGLKPGRVHLRVGSDGVPMATAAPDVPEEAIEAFVRSKRAWLQRQTSTKTLSHDYKDGDAFLLMGRIVRLELVVGAEAARCVAQGSRLILYLRGSDASIELRRALIGAAFAGELRKVLDTRLPFWMERMGIRRRLSVRFSNARRMWACCRPERSQLCFSIRAAALDPSLIDYLIVHELAHLRVRGHGPAFRAEVERVLPDRKEREDSLRRCYLDSFF